MYVRFRDSKELIECTVTPSGNVVTMKFTGNVVVDTSGFHLYLDEKGEYDIGGNDYLGFTTIYRNDEETRKYNGYQLSNDGSVYIEPQPMPEPEPYTPTPEEIAEQERQEKIAELNSQISALKSELASTDYIYTKSYEANTVGETLTEYDFSELHAQRQMLRDEINALEDELNNLLNGGEV